MEGRRRWTLPSRSEIMRLSRFCRAELITWGFRELRGREAARRRFRVWTRGTLLCQGQRYPREDPTAPFGRCLCCRPRVPAPTQAVQAQEIRLSRLVLPSIEKWVLSGWSHGRRRRLGHQSRSQWQLVFLALLRRFRMTPGGGRRRHEARPRAMELLRHPGQHAIFEHGLTVGAPMSRLPEGVVEECLEDSSWGRWGQLCAGDPPPGYLKTLLHCWMPASVPPFVRLRMSSKAWYRSSKSTKRPKIICGAVLFGFKRSSIQQMQMEVLMIQRARLSGRRWKGILPGPGVILGDAGPVWIFLLPWTSFKILSWKLLQTRRTLRRGPVAHLGSTLLYQMHQQLVPVPIPVGPPRCLVIF
mmetsp:Transcript_45503/g.103099  ORF Transcript_45503/g.103099 Transcript_45503/m.103099 type:complete len:357 (+) Transcript_45503:205-1275(+)